MAGLLTAASQPGNAQPPAGQPTGQPLAQPPVTAGPVAPAGPEGAGDAPNVSPEEQAQYDEFVANGMTNRFGQTTGPLLAGGLFAAGGINAVFFGAAAFLCAMAIFYIYLFRRAPAPD